MRANATFILILCLLLLAGAAAAADNSAISTPSNPWVVANGADQSVYTVTVQNTTGLVSGATVTFTVDNAVYGTMSPVTVTTNAFGTAQSTFTVKKKSGSALVSATITYSDGGSPVNVTKSQVQFIDHDTPYFDVSFSNPLFTYPAEGEVGTEVPFHISMNDQWNNPIDNRTGPHIVTLQVNSPLVPDDCAFVNGTEYTHGISLPLNGDGTLDLRVKLTNKTGTNYVQMSPIGSITMKTVGINAVNGYEPFSMTGSISPAISADYGEVRANNIDLFILDYYLYDVFGNPMANRSVLISTNLTGEETQTEHFSDSTGLIRFYYGPKISLLTANITAIAKNNSSVSKNLYAGFVSAEPVVMVFAMTPQAMASRETPGFTPARVIGKVTDTWGNPVKGQTVTFTILSPITNTPAAAVTGNPSFSSASAVTTISNTTDNNGNAIAYFYSGSFISNQTHPNYSATASGSCPVQAQWGSQASQITAEWKNYPYFSVSVNATPQTVTVNETINVTIDVKGDGWAMEPRPIDVVLCTDRSGSMMYDNPDRMVNIMTAAGAFVDDMSTNDQIGLVSFGQKGTAEAITYTPSSGGQLGPGSDLSTWDDSAYRAAHYPSSPKYYADYATVDLALNFNKAQVKTSINTMVPYSGTPMRSALYKSINEIIAHQQANNTVKGIVLLSDGDYNYYGDPLARGTGSSTTDPSDYTDLTLNYRTFTGLGTGKFSNQNMSVYAKNNNIRIYSIAFGNQISSGGRQTLSLLANATGGKYYTASATDVTDVYRSIAGELKDTAGANATMNLSFQNVQVNSTPMPGQDVFDYVPVTTTTWPNGTVTTRDQSGEWVAPNYQLQFDIGTLKVGQIWRTEYRLKVKKAGLIKLFGSGNTISFKDVNGNDVSMNVPEYFILANPNTTPTGLQSGDLDIRNLQPHAGQYNTTVPMSWELNYTGFDTVTERYYYSYNNQPFVQFAMVQNIPSTGGVYVTRATSLDVRKFPAGNYRILVRATVPGVGSDEEYGTFFIPSRDGLINIKLE